jgi:methylmalonyl-CoA mutase cobalamin-binding subunit
MLVAKIGQDGHDRGAYTMLESAGVKAIFGPGTQIPAAARRVLGLISGGGRSELSAPG